MERMLASVAPHIACYGMRAPEGLLKRCRQGIAENVAPFHIGGAEVIARKRREVREAREDFRPYVMINIYLQLHFFDSCKDQILPAISALPGDAAPAMSCEQ